MTKKMNTKKFRKLFLLFVVIFITSVVLVVETYAWFVGITTVNVSEFEVTVTGAQGLELSLNGRYWTNLSGGSSNNTLTLTRENVISTAAGNINQGYEGSGNAWPENGLIPLSSAGVLSSSGRLQMFAKSSLSATQGGYRLIANQIDNYTSTEQDGYIAFDLFIRNGTENTYSASNYSSAGGENIYLTRASNATTAGGSNGATYSVRVGFFQIAGTKTTTSTTSATLTALRGLSCSTETSGNNKKICPQNGSDRALSWNIWEPRYHEHNPGAKNYFNQLCKQRDSQGAYTSTTCSGFLSVTDVLDTYAIYHTFDSSANVDIYDGLNGYNGTSTTTYSSSSTTPLMKMNNYRLDDNIDYTYNNPLFKLAGNSITKVRVYIWLEGQDVDNYDVIAGDTIKINFGFTKDRYGIENT